MKLINCILFVMLLAGCTAQKDTFNPDELIRNGFVKVEVVDMRSLDGCEFVLKLADGTSLEPIAMKDEYKTNGLQLFVKYNLITDQASICMVGSIVELTEVVVAKK
jgi:hypothetical protein